MEPDGTGFFLGSEDLLQAGLGVGAECVAGGAPELERAGASHRAKAEALQTHLQKRPVRLTAKTLNRTSPGASSDSFTSTSARSPSER